MSAETLDALKAAVDQHVRDESPGSVTGAWILLTETTNLDDLDHDEGGMWVTTTGNPFTCRGLIEIYRDSKPEEDA